MYAVVCEAMYAVVCEAMNARRSLNSCTASIPASGGLAVDTIAIHSKYFGERAGELQRSTHAACALRASLRVY
jgi:hypothetical protein